MLEHTYVCETPRNPTTQVASPSETAHPCGDIHCLANHMTRVSEVEQDTILGDHIPASSFSSNVNVSCQDSDCSTSGVPRALDSPSIQSLRGRHCLPGVAAWKGHVSFPSFGRRK